MITFLACEIHVKWEFILRSLIMRIMMRLLPTLRIYKDTKIDFLSQFRGIVKPLKVKSSSMPRMLSCCTTTSISNRNPVASLLSFPSHDVDEAYCNTPPSMYPENKRICYMKSVRGNNLSDKQLTTT